jgi:hypothetical protein
MVRSEGTAFEGTSLRQDPVFLETHGIYIFCEQLLTTKARVQVDSPHIGVENVAPSVALPEVSSGSGKTTTFNFSFVVN